MLLHKRDPFSLLKPGFHIATGGAQPHESPVASAQSRHEVYLSQAAAASMRCLQSFGLHIIAADCRDVCRALWKPGLMLRIQPSLTLRSYKAYCFLELSPYSKSNENTIFCVPENNHGSWDTVSDIRFVGPSISVRSVFDQSCRTKSTYFLFDPSYRTKSTYFLFDPSCRTKSTYFLFLLGS